MRRNFAVRKGLELKKIDEAGPRSTMTLPRTRRESMATRNSNKRIASEVNRIWRRNSITGAVSSFLAALLILTAPFVAAGNEQKSKDQKKTKTPAKVASPVVAGLPVTELNETEAILHALNRLTYGPRPGDVERVRKIGLANWIEQQLNPDSIDDSQMQARLEKYPTLKMSSQRLLNEFPQPQVAARREGKTIEEYRKEQQEKQQQANRQMNAGMGDQQDSEATGANGDVDASGKASNITKQGYNGGDPNRSPMQAYQQIKTPQRVTVELSMAKMDRAVFSDRQLYEQMADFWFNHFNVFAGKGADRWMMTAYERDSIRPHAMGKFEDLVAATAKSPAMMFYLDNWLSADPNTPQKINYQQMRRGPFGFPQQGRFPQQQQQQQQKQKREYGLNENYGRELMELHTLGVDGGYSQKDVIEVAKCFTGWTIRQPQQNPDFYYNDAMHIRGSKTVLDHTIEQGGMNEGLQVIHLLAHDPHTAHHIAFQIAQHFVSDVPPAALVDKMSQTFLSSDGDIKAALHTMIYSPEFWTREAFRSKIKTPFELVVSAARAVNASVDLPLPMVMWTARIGQPLYNCQPPTGYKDDAETWVNTGALLNRLNYSLTLAGGRMRGTHVDMAALEGIDPTTQDPKIVLDKSIEMLLYGNISAQTRTTLEKQLEDPQVLQARLDDPVKRVNIGMVSGLVLGAPEFQRR
jgi:uncharacterized protein (DUF1800 family)